MTTSQNRITHLLLVVALAIFPLTSAGDEVHPLVAAAQSQRVEVMEQAAQSVIAMFGPQGEGGGSGVVITPDGYALSNFHVTSACGDLMKCGMADGRLYDAVIVGIDPTGDVALVKLLGRDDFPAAPLGDSDDVEVGEWAFAMGNPFLLATDFRPTSTYGIISGVHRYQYPAGTILEYTDCLQTDASINPGNSGGPLFNLQGEVIGINGRGSFEKRGRVNVGVGYAISINQIKNFLGYLRSGRVVDHASLGATVASDAQGRVIVSDILEGSDAYRRGLRFGDELVRFGGRSVRTVNAFKNVLGIFPQGWRVPLVFRREGEIWEVWVRLEPLHAPGELESILAGRPIGAPDERPDGEQPQPPGRGGNRQPDDLPAEDDSADAQVEEEPDSADSPAQFVTKRRGYANYYFNQLERDRVWDLLATQVDAETAATVWRLAGDIVGGGEFDLLLDEQVSQITLPGDVVEISVSDDLSHSLDPQGSGGLLAALSMWRRLLARGPDGYGQIYYLGTAPLIELGHTCDVLVGISAGVECWFYVDPQSGQLACVEMYPTDGVDPCLVYLSEYHRVDGQHLPHRIDVRHGDGPPYAVLEVQQFGFTVSPEESP